MQQPKIRIKDTSGKDWGIKDVMSVYWDYEEKISMIIVNFMGTRSSNDWSPFYPNYKDKNIFENAHGNLKGTLIYDQRRMD